MGNDKEPDLKYVDYGQGRREATLGEWWSSADQEARFELLSESGLVDLITDDLKGLADAFDLLIHTPWAMIPEDIRRRLEMQVSVERRYE